MMGVEIKMKRIWLPRILRIKKTQEEVFTYADDHGMLHDIVSNDMTMDYMTEFLISYLSAKVLKLKEHAKLIKRTLKFEIEGTQEDNEISENEFISVCVRMKEPEGLNFKQYTKDDLEDNEN